MTSPLTLKEMYTKEYASCKDGPQHFLFLPYLTCHSNVHKAEIRIEFILNCQLISLFKKFVSIIVLSFGTILLAIHFHVLN